MTYRERRERKAERLQEWAAKRREKAETAQAGAHRIMDGIPFGQPILVGHHSEKHARRDQERIHNGFAKAQEHSAKAEDFLSRSAGIANQLDSSIYSDDPDAIEQLETRIAELEAKRQRMKEVSKMIRAAHKHGGEPEVLELLKALNQNEATDLLVVAKHQAYYKPLERGYPPYSSQNLSGNINRNKKRLEQLKAQNGKPPQPRLILSRYGNTCDTCKGNIPKGELIYWVKGQSVECKDCGSPKPEEPKPEAKPKPKYDRSEHQIEKANAHYTEQQDKQEDATNDFED